MDSVSRALLGKAFQELYNTIKRFMQPSESRAGGGNSADGQGMKAEVHYERTEKKTSFDIKFSWGRFRGGDYHDDDDEDEVDVGVKI
ncbi:unnamed protein product [Linum trigynum]|uniref:Uncharacterized protein n=1 Tax=Linum trigynum TaxID=586398 RepID=A0AAV2DU66_9ROSI